MKLFVCVVLLASAAGLCSAGPSLHGMLKGKESGNIWALLVAGSNSWMNYRHQVFIMSEFLQGYVLKKQHALILM